MSDVPTAPEAAAISATPPPAEAAREERVSTIVGDRLCVKCGFNLTGQPIFREPRYQLFIARCPECGAAAALQEYPVLGKWANRWASLAAALWLFILFGGAFVFSMIVFGTSLGATDMGSYELARIIATLANPDTTGQHSHMVIDTDWWATQSGWTILRDAGGFWKVSFAPAAGFWIGLFWAGLCFGVIGSVALLHARRARASLALSLPIIIAAIFQIITYFNRLQNFNSNMTATAYDAAVVTLGPVLIPLADVSVYLGIVFGVLIGRPLVRLLVRSMLPPRYRSALSFLWLTDGKEPPTSAR